MLTNAVSLFSGVGMADLALRERGIPTVALCEIDPQAAGVLAHQFPGTTIYDDVKDVTGEHLRADGFAGPDGGLIFGGSPCQDLSVAGQRRGLDGHRSGLWWEMVRIADETQAEWLIWENVPGALSSAGGRDFGTILGSLADLGMGFAWRVLDGQHFGVPQRRRRVFLVARRASDGADCAEVLLEREGGGGDTAAGHQPQPHPARAARPSIASDHVGVFGQGKFGGYDPGLKPLNASMYKRPEDTVVVGALTSTGVGTCGADDNQGQAGHLIPTTFVKGHRAANPDDYETWVPDGPAPTLNAFDNATETRATVVSVMGDPAVRRLTPTECERLMGLPDDWTRWRIDPKKGLIEQADSSRYRQCGNGLIVPVVEWIIGRIQGRGSSERP